jgi:hypothetical protein
MIVAEPIRQACIGIPYSVLSARGVQLLFSSHLILVGREWFRRHKKGLRPSPRINVTSHIATFMRHKRQTSRQLTTALCEEEDKNKSVVFTLIISIPVRTDHGASTSLLPVDRNRFFEGAHYFFITLVWESSCSTPYSINSANCKLGMLNYT